MNKPKVILGMSGGMDSSMSAILLQRDGYEVIGATLLTHGDEQAESIQAAIKLAHDLNIQHHLIDCRKQFKSDVIDYFINDYLQGKTPNACIHCNKTIKWKLLNDLAIQTNCDFIATGHYVQTKTFNGHHYIARGTDPAKDQSYFLWNLDEEIIKKALFPLGKLKKSEVRDLARTLGYTEFADKKESMGVCFLKGSNYRDFLIQELPPHHPALQKGEVIDDKGNLLGHHEGFPHYTIGQKRGIENVTKGNCVIRIQPEFNTLITGVREKLFTTETIIKDISLSEDNDLWKDKIFIRIRGLDSVPGYWGKIKPEEDSIHVFFDEPVWALSPGQSIVFYHEDMLIGGGIIP